MAANEITIRVVAKDDASPTLTNVRTRVGEMAIGFGTGLVAVGALVGGLKVLGGQLTGTITSFMESEKVTAQLNAVLKSTHGVAGVTAGEVERLSSTLQGLTGTSDEELTRAQALMLTFTAIGKDIFPQATEAALNLSTAFGQDLQSSTIQVAKALQDPIAGVTALRRVGVTLTDQQEVSIKTFMALGEVEKAQGVILAELETQVGGAARAFGETTSGKLKRFSEAIDNMKERIGEAIVKGFDPLIAKMVGWTGSKEAEQFTNDFAKAMGDLATAIGDVADAFGTLKKSWDLLPPNLLRKIGAETGEGIAGGVKKIFDIEGMLGLPLGPAGLGPGGRGGGLTDFETGSDPNWRRMLTENRNGMGSTAAGGSLVADILSRSEEELTKVRIASNKAQADLWIDQVANPAAVATGRLSGAMGEAEKRMAEAFEITEIRNLQLAHKILEEAELAAAEGARKNAEAQEAAARSADFFRDFLQGLAGRNVRFAPGVFETIAAAGGLNPITSATQNGVNVFVP